jgi:hypothetical protein
MNLRLCRDFSGETLHDSQPHFREDFMNSEPIDSRSSALAGVRAQPELLHNSASQPTDNPSLRPWDRLSWNPCLYEEMPREDAGISPPTIFRTLEHIFWLGCFFFIPIAFWGLAYLLYLAVR